MSLFSVEITRKFKNGCCFGISYEEHNGCKFQEESRVYVANSKIAGSKSIIQ